MHSIADSCIKDYGENKVLAASTTLFEAFDTIVESKYIVSKLSNTISLLFCIEYTNAIQRKLKSLTVYLGNGRRL